MPLSIAKLQDLLNTKGYIPNKYYVMDDMVFYIELFAIKTADIFLLYIPSKYNFSVSSSGENVFKIKYINMDSSETVEDEYAGTPDNVDIEATYGDVNIELSPDKNKLEEHLEDAYRHPVSLKDISKDDTIVLKALYRQMRRLRYCVQNIKYKLAVLYKNYFCAIRRDDSIDCMTIKHFPRVDCKKLLVVADLEMLYEKGEKLIEDIHSVRSSIYKVLERNQGMHTRVIDKMTNNRKDIVLIPQQAQAKKLQYDSIISDLEEMLATMLDAEKEVMEKLYQTEQENRPGLASDITNAHEKARLEKELDRINFLKSEITKNMLAVRNKRENTILSVDKIMFDNAVMFDCMIKNFAKLKGFC
uniref:Uncharacterized protein n=1 Tax=viral metagenome TaxID=1070528 RepID=A0A6C0EMJ6_9ZZZZ